MDTELHLQIMLLPWSEHELPLEQKPVV